MDKIDVKYLLELSEGKDVTYVANFGCGPNAPREIQFVSGLRANLIPFDIKHYPGTIAQDMEWISFDDDIFEGVMCINALDHTKDAQKALEELIRVAEDWVYINCNLDQKTTSGRGHHWDAKKDGTFTNGTDSFNLTDYGFTLHNITFGGDRRYDQVIGVLEK